MGKAELLHIPVRIVCQKSGVGVRVSCRKFYEQKSET